MDSKKPEEPGERAHPKAKPEPKRGGLGEVLGETSQLVLALQGTKALARKRRVSVKTIQRRLREVEAKASEVKDERRKRITLELLKTDMPFREVARRLNLSSAPTFTRFVKRLFGITPSKLRRSL